MPAVSGNGITRTTGMQLGPYEERQSFGDCWSSSPAPYCSLYWPEALSVRLVHGSRTIRDALIARMSKVASTSQHREIHLYAGTGEALCAEREQKTGVIRFAHPRRPRKSDCAAKEESSKRARVAV